MIISFQAKLSELMFHNNVVLSARYLDITLTTNMGIARAGTLAMVTKIYKFHNVSPILAILQKRRITVE